MKKLLKMNSLDSKYFYSGFSLQNEQELFSDYLTQNNYTIAGFSYGAQKAFEYALNTNDRIDKIQLFSPAFFQCKDKKYKRMQLMFFKKDAVSYCNSFLSNCTSPNDVNLLKFFKQGAYEQLEELLYYEWNEEKLNKLISKNIQIEVFLGFEDKIIEAQEAKEFFKKYATVYFVKNVGHILT